MSQIIKNIAAAGVEKKHKWHLIFKLDIKVPTAFSYISGSICARSKKSL